MTKQEFEKMINAEVSAGDFAVIDRVYTWHPAITDTEGKQQVKALYEAAGMTVFYDMLERAHKACNLDAERAKLSAQLAEVNKKIEENAKGEMPAFE